MILVDAGPLIALLHDGDSQHDLCKQVARTLREPLVTIWPVVTEAMHMLSFSWEAQAALLDILETRTITLLPLDASDIPRIDQLMLKYRDLPMDFADAALVRVAERDRIRRVFTLDRRDFRLYRPLHLQGFLIVP